MRTDDRTTTTGRRALVAILLVAAALVTTAACGARERQVVTGGVGTQVRDDDFEFTLKKIEDVRQDEWNLIVVTVDVRNRDKDNEFFTTNLQLLRTKDGAEHNHNTAAATDIDRVDATASIRPRSTSTRTLVYSVPANAEPAAFVFREEGETLGVELRLP